MSPCPTRTPSSSPWREAPAVAWERRVALRSADIDLVKIHGYGFPRWRRGPMHYAEARGLAEIVAVLDRLSADGLAEPACDGLRRAASGGGFSALAG